MNRSGCSEFFALRFTLFLHSSLVPISRLTCDTNKRHLVDSVPIFCLVLLKFLFPIMKASHNKANHDDNYKDAHGCRNSNRDTVILVYIIFTRDTYNNK